jgi:glycine/sarcosine N-methyltransferase
MLDLTAVPEADFELIACLDNALPHLDSEDLLLRAATQIRQKLRRGATFIASMRDYDRLVQERPTVQGPVFYSDQGRRRIVHQVWDWINEREYVFHLYITQEVRDDWDVQHYVSNYRAVLREELNRILDAAGFTDSRWIFEAESGFYQPIVIAKAK